MGGVVGGHNAEALDNALLGLYPADLEELERKAHPSAGSSSLSASASEAATEEDDGGREAQQKLTEAMLSQHSVVAMSQSPEEVAAQLPKEFSEEDFDAVQWTLDSLPPFEGRAVGIGRGGTTENALALVSQSDTEFIMNAIGEKDVEMDSIMSLLAASIEATYPNLISCMKGVREIDMESARACVQIVNSRRRLAAANKYFSDGPVKVLKLRKKADRLREVIELTGEIHRLRDSEKQIEALLEHYNFAEAVTQTAALRKSLFDDPLLKRVVALDPVRERVASLMPDVRVRVDKALFSVCKRGAFSTPAYDAIVSSYLMLDEMGVVPAVLPSLEEGGILMSDRQAGMRGLADRVLRFLIRDMQTCLYSAVLAAGVDPDAGEPTELTRNVSTDANTMASALGEHLPVTEIVGCLVRLCELLTEVLHTYYLILQWHQDSSNSATAAAATDAADNNTKDKDGPVSPPAFDPEQEFEIARDRLQHQAHKLWSVCEKMVSGLMAGANQSAGVQLSEFLAMRNVMETLASMGAEMTGADPLQLRACLRRTCVQFYLRSHSESMAVVKQMLERETWDSFPLKFAEIGGMPAVLHFPADGQLDVQFPIALASIPAVHSPVLYRPISSTTKAVSGAGIEETKASSSGNDAIQQPGAGETGEAGEQEAVSNGSRTSLFATFRSQGNPFSAAAGQHAAGDTNGDANESAGPSAALFHVDFPDAEMSATALESVVFTQSALNGVGKYLGNYLRILVAEPSLAPEVLDGIKHLSYLYILDVFAILVPAQLVARILKFDAARPPEDISSQEWGAFEKLAMWMQHVVEALGDTARSVLPHAALVGGTSGSSHHTASSLGAGSGAADGMPPLASGLQHLRNRIVAAESCSFVVAVLEQVRHMLPSLVQSKELVSQFVEFTYQAKIAVGHLRTLLYRCAMSPVVGFECITAAVERETWDPRSPREEPAGFVALVSGRLGAVWTALWEYSAEDGGLSDVHPDVIEQTWRECVQMCYAAVLDGFSRVRKTSQAGIGCMAMDLRALKSALDDVHGSAPERDHTWVDGYTKAMFFNDSDSGVEELLRWIGEHRTQYSLRHANGLVQHCLSSRLRKKRQREVLMQVQQIYASSQPTPGASSAQASTDTNLMAEAALDALSASIR